jgi:hypothetical protein
MGNTFYGQTRLKNQASNVDSTKTTGNVGIKAAQFQKYVLKLRPMNTCHENMEYWPECDIF